MNIKQGSIIKTKDRTMFTIILDELLQHGNVKVQGFGIFRLKRMKKHKRYLPGLHKVGTVPERVKISFIPTKKFKDKLQKYHGK